MVGALGTVITAIVTPFSDDLSVDEDAFVELMHHLAEHGSDGFVVCGTTGEASTMSDDEHLRVIELAVAERPAGVTIIGGTGSNDTRHAVHLTERATALGVDATLSVTPYYNRPSPLGITRHYEEIARATDRPIMLYNIPLAHRDEHPARPPGRAGADRERQRRQAGQPQRAALIDGLEIYAGNNETFRPTLDMGGAGGILTASHVVGDEMRRMVDEPENRAEIDASLHDVYKTLFITASPTATKAALNLMGLRAGTLRLPLVEATEDELAQVRAMLERHGRLENATA